MDRDPDALGAALARTLGALAVRETHCSWVFLTDTRAYKLKRPVHFGFVDLSTPAARRHACEEEVRINQELAPAIYLAVRSVLWPPEGPRLGDADDPDAVDWVVEMRRFDEGRTMAERARSGTLASEHAAAIGRRVAAFHAGAAVLAREDAAEAALQAWVRNLDELEAVAPVDLLEQVGALRAFGRAFVVGRGAELDARAAAGLIRDGHGDLRAEHVLIDDGITIVDRLEFDQSLRQIDVADDLAFLLMDLEALGVRWAAEAVLAAYRETGGESGDDGLLAFFAAYRASVRAKVELLRAAQLAHDAATAGADRARGLLGLAEHCAWRARPPAQVVVCGPPASGKSHLAAAIAARTGATLLSSDAVRKELLGLAAAERAPVAAYGDEGRSRVYDELARRARALAPGAPVVVDATFGTRAQRETFTAGLADHGAPLRWIECQTPVATLAERARHRSVAQARGSDADAEVAVRLARAFEPLDEIPRARHLPVDGTAPTGQTIRRIAGWIDDASAEDLVDRAPRRRPGAVAVPEPEQQLR